MSLGKETELAVKSYTLYNRVITKSIS